MQTHDPIILLLDDIARRVVGEVPELALRVGFRVVVAAWSDCAVSNHAVSITAGHLWLTDGSKAPLPGPTRINPAIIAVLAPCQAALRHGAELAASSDALWGHCDLIQQWQWPKDASEDDYVGGAMIMPDASAPFGVRASSFCAQRALAALRESAGTTPFTRALTCAPCAVYSRENGYVLLDGLAPGCPAEARHSETLTAWLVAARARVRPPAPLELQQDWFFPALYDTRSFIGTDYVPDAVVLHLDTGLEAERTTSPDQLLSLKRLLARRRSDHTLSDWSSKRFVEPGVGRTCMVDGLHSYNFPELADFTVLGVGLTPYSEGGFVEVGRQIDGKAAVKRCWHRKLCADRLEEAGARCGRAVAMFELPGEGITMLDGSLSSMALLVRGFRCTHRVKTLDPLISCMHSVQHTPLVHAYVAQHALAMRRQRGGAPDDLGLTRVLMLYNAAQESFREVISGAPPSPSDASWPAIVRQVRLNAILQYAPFILRDVFGRLARELELPTGAVDEAVYLSWFAACLGHQLAVWRKLRFLHDYHHPGTSRFAPGHLYTLGENNVTLLGEFPDLDTGVFVDDSDESLIDVLQLTADDVAVLRKRYLFFHQREIEEAQTVVRSVASLLTHCFGPVDVDTTYIFEKAYDDARNTRTSARSNGALADARTAAAG